MPYLLFIYFTYKGKSVLFIRIMKVIHSADTQLSIPGLKQKTKTKKTNRVTIFIQIKNHSDKMHNFKKKKRHNYLS